MRSSNSRPKPIRATWVSSIVSANRACPPNASIRGLTVHFRLHAPDGPYERPKAPVRGLRPRTTARSSGAGRRQLPLSLDQFFPRIKLFPELFDARIFQVFV